MDDVQAEAEEFCAVVSARAVAACNLFVAKTYERYYLTGVYIAPHPVEGAWIVATDGHTMFVVWDATAHVVGSGIVSLSRAMKISIARRDAVILAVKDKRASILEDDTVRFLRSEAQKDDGCGEPFVDAAHRLAVSPNRHVSDHQWRDVLIDGTFPNWQRVVQPMAAVVSDASFQAKYVNRFGRAFALVNNEKIKCAIRIVPTEGGGALNSSAPHYVLGSRATGTSLRAFGVIMPISHQEIDLPDWMPLLAPAKAA